MRVILSFELRLFILMLPMMSLLGYDQFCSENSINSRYNGCFQASKLDEGFINGIPTFFEIRHIYMLCRRNDSLSACLNKSMFNCSSLFYDVEAYTNTFRALCTNENETAEMFESPWLCDFGTQMNHCLKDYRVNVKTEHVYHNSSDIPEDDLCTVFQKLRTCLYVEPSGDCQQNHSDFLNNIFRQRFSPSQCITLKQTTSQTSKAHSHGSPCLCVLFTILYVVVRVICFDDNYKWSAMFDI